MNPKVSVLMPVFNGSEYLGLAIESVLSQSFRDFELIVLDDGSTENISSIVNGYHDSRIRFYSRENKGLGATLNELIGYARGDYLARMDADDVCLPNRFFEQVKALDEDKSLVMVGGQIKFLVGSNTCPAFPMPRDHETIASELSFGRFPICHPCLMFRSSACKSVGGYRLAGAGEDLDFFLRMSEVGRLANVGDVVLHYRLHASSLSLKKQGDLEKGYAFALYSANCRRTGMAEPSVSEFEDGFWKARGLYTKVKVRGHSISERFYRNFIVARGQGEGLKSIFFLGLASALRPVRTVTRTAQIFSKLIGRAS